MTPPEIRRLAAFGLPGAPHHLALSARRLVEPAVQHRVTGFLAAAVAANAIDEVDDDVRTLVAERHLDALAACLRLEVVLGAAVTLFASHDVEALVLKGPALAHSVYCEPELRTFGDVDLLVRAADWSRARDLLVGVGGSPAFGEPRAGFTARFGKGVCVTLPNQLEIDLHRTFVAGAYGLVFDADALFDHPSTVRVGGVEVKTLSRPDLLVHAAAHAVLGGRTPAVVPLRDVAELCARAADLDVVVARADELRLGAVLARGVLVTEAALGVEIGLHDWAHAYHPSRFDRRSLAAYTHRRSYAAQAASGVLALDRWRDRAAYASALLAPDRGYLDAREGTYFRRLTRGVRVARGRSRR